MNYGITGTETIKPQKRLEAGIHTGFFLSRIEVVAKTDKSSAAIDIFFKQGDSDIEIKERFWEVTDGGGRFDEKTQKNMFDQLMRRLVCISQALIGQKPINGGDSFATFAANYKKALETKTNIELRLKLTYDNNGYLELGRFIPFIEPAALKDSKIEINKDELKKMERTEKGAPAQKNTSSGSKDDTDEMPF